MSIVRQRQRQIIEAIVEAWEFLRTVNWRSALFSSFALPLLGVIYWIVNSQGVRLALPIFGMKLYKVPVPGFSFMQHYQNLRDLDLAHVFAMFMLFAVWRLGLVVLNLLLLGEEADDRLNAKFHTPFIVSLSVIVIICDIAMFYRGVLDQGGLLDTAGSFTAIVATLGYTGLLAFVAYVHVMLKQRIS